jgi:Holliday junction DNA helicase RuvA
VIASVRGQVVALGPDGAVVEVGGVGLTVHCTPGTLARLRVGEPARLATSLVVREDSLTLYGFADDDERSLFEMLQTASGVGPRLAQAILAVLPPAQARLAIAGSDVRTLTRVPGIGKKGAERLVVELRDRVGPASDAGVPGLDTGGVAPVQPWRDQVGQALVGLGWSAREADEAVQAVADQAAGGADVPALLRAALRLLGKG